MDGRVLGRGRAEYPVLVPSAGQAESDPGDWWRATARAVRQAVAQTAGAEIVALAVAGQMHGLVLARAAAASADDEAASATTKPRQSTKPRQPTKPVADAAGGRRRGARGGDPLAGPARRAEVALYGDAPAITGGLGNRPSPGMAGPILCWLGAHEPQNLRSPGGRCSPRTGSGCG